MQHSRSTQNLSQSEAGFTGAVESTSTTSPGSNQTDRLFSDWKAIGNLSLYERVLVSVLLSDFLGSRTVAELDSYLKSLTVEAKISFKTRAEKIVADYSIDVKKYMLQDNLQEMWIEATKKGIRDELDEFTSNQADSSSRLNDFIRKKTSLRSQFLSAFLVALALSILVPLIRPVSTLYDEIMLVISPPKQPAVTPASP